jgi:hypothetical protein
MWRTALLSRPLRLMSFSRGGAARNGGTESSPEQQHFGPMSDQQLAAAIRQFRRSPFEKSPPGRPGQASRAGTARWTIERTANRLNEVV